MYKKCLTMYNASFTLGALINQSRGNTMEHQLTYMDIKRKEQRVSDKRENIKGIIAAVGLFVIYAIVSTMDYQDCLRGATC